MNRSWGNTNPFKWINKQTDQRITTSFNYLVLILANANGVHTEQFRKFMYWCFENQRSIAEAEADPRPSIEIWKEAKNKNN